MEQIDLTPEGVRKDPARVANAMRAKEEAASALLHHLMMLHTDYMWILSEYALEQDDHDLRDDLERADKLFEKLTAAQEELMRAVAGFPSETGQSKCEKHPIGRGGTDAEGEHD